MPRTIGQGSIHYRQLDYVLDVDEELPQFITKDISDVERKISQHIAELIPNGATLQMGIGNIPNAVLSALGNHQNLGVHTEMFSDGLIPLLENGVVNNLKKSFMNSKTVTSFIMGSQKLYDYVNDNVTVIFLDASVVNNPSIIVLSIKFKFIGI
jgi:4-hydroxybutyrate CoA-transferase